MTTDPSSLELIIKSQMALVESRRTLCKNLKFYTRFEAMDSGEGSNLFLPRSMDQSHHLSSSEAAKSGVRGFM